MAVGDAARRLITAARSGSITQRANEAAKSLKAEFNAGQQGDETPPVPIWAGPKGQFEAIMALLRDANNVTPDGNAGGSHVRSDGGEVQGHGGEVRGDGGEARGDGGEVQGHGGEVRGDGGEDSGGEARGDGDGGEVRGERGDGSLSSSEDQLAVSQAIAKVDWSKVRSTTSERSGEATRMMRSMAQQVDWAKLGPAATKVSSALIAAVASGQLPVGGRMGGQVARAIVNQGGLGQQVGQAMQGRQQPMPEGFSSVIETTITGD